jgi:hypothetical protein
MKLLYALPDNISPKFLVYNLQQRGRTEGMYEKRTSWKIKRALKEKIT